MRTAISYTRLIFRSVYATVVERRLGHDTNGIIAGDFNRSRFRNVASGASPIVEVAKVRTSLRFTTAVVATISVTLPFFGRAMPASAATSGAASPTGRAVPCARTSVASVRPPSGAAAYQHGTLRLANGASVWIEGPSTDYGVIAAVHMSPGDAVAACYGSARRYADAGDARAISVLDLKTSGSYGNVVGSWPGAK